MAHNNTHRSARQTLVLNLGPLTYALQAYDRWGATVLNNIAKHTTILHSDKTPDRIIHLVRHSQKGIIKHSTLPLPAQLEKYLPADHKQATWQIQNDQINCLWLGVQTRHTFWTATASSTIGRIRFHLPWGLIINDLIKLGGGVIHGGLACYGESGCLFLAPPGGGKSTTLSTAPGDWTVLSDDAALVWPDGRGSWFASPLPAWGNLLRQQEAWRYQELPLHRCCRIVGLFMIKKGASIHLKHRPQTAVVPFVYRSLCEYPAAITATELQKEALFRTAASISRELPAWELSLPLHGNIWPLLAEVA